VFYQDEVVLGGGLIETSLPEDAEPLNSQARDLDSSALPPVITV